MVITVAIGKSMTCEFCAQGHSTHGLGIAIGSVWSNLARRVIAQQHCMLHAAVDVKSLASLLSEGEGSWECGGMGRPSLWRRRVQSAMHMECG